MKMLSGRGLTGELVPYHLGHFFIAIDTEAFMGSDQFKKTAGDILRELRNSSKAPGEKRIYTAGEKEYDVWMERKEKGLPLTEASKNDIITVNKLFDINFDLPF